MSSAVMTSRTDICTVYAIVLNYNGKHFNSRCLHSLLRQDYPGLHILFVDNGSTDASLEAVRSEFADRLEYLDNGENLYFAAGNNRGIQLALDRGADYVFIVNNDTELAPDCVTELVRFIERHPEAGGCQPLLCNLGKGSFLRGKGSTINSAGIKISLSGRSWDDMQGLPVESVPELPFEVAGITGGGMFLPASVVAEQAGFDESYIMYFEDVDLSCRIRRSGKALYTVPAAQMGHMVAATTSEYAPLLRVRQCETNSYRLILGHFPKSIRARALLVSTVFTAGSFLINLLKGNPGMASAVAQGGWNGFRLLLKGGGTPSPDDVTRDMLRPFIQVDTFFPPKP